MTLVLLHPVALDRECWSFTGLDGVAWEFPGHGRAPLPSAEYTFEEVADQLVAAVAGPLDLVGVSKGGSLAQTIAVRHPDRVRSVMCACSGAGSTPRLDRAEATLAHGMAATVDETLTRWFSAEALADPAHPGVAYARQRLLSDDPRAVAALWAAPSSAGDRLHSVTVPVTVLIGRQDAAVSIQRGVDLHARFPLARLEVIEGTHMMMLERPAEFAAAVARHLSWVDLTLERQARLPQNPTHLT